MIGKTPAAIWLVPAIALIVAVLPLPYGYYTLLRLVVCGAATWLACAYGKDGAKGWMISFILAAIVFNPIIPITFARGVWAIIDLVGAILFFVGLRSARLAKSD